MGIAGKTGAAYLTSAFWGSLMLGRLVAVPVALRVKPRWILIIDLTGCLIAVSIIALRPKSLFAVWSGTIILGLSIASLFPATINFAERNISITGQMTSWFLVGGSAGSMFFPWLIGQFFEAFGPQVMIIILLIDFIAAFGLLFAVFISL